MRACLKILSLGTGVALLAAPARADIPPDPNSVHAHCTLVEQCSAGVFCDYAWSPGGKPEESEKVGEDCRIGAAAKGLEERCRSGGNYSGQTLFCPKGATGTWSPDGKTAVPVPAPVVEPPRPVEPVQAAEPVKSEPVKSEPVKAEPKQEEVKSGCAVDPSTSGWLGLLVLLGMRRRRG